MKEGETMYFPKPAINENDLAIIERGDTAEHSISAGQYVSWKGKLGKANSAILQGATLDDTLFDYSNSGALNVKSMLPDYANKGSTNLINGGLTTYTVDKAGWYAFRGYYFNGGITSVSINGVLLAFNESHYTSSWSSIAAMFPADVGDVITMVYATNGPYSLTYIPFK